MATLEEIWAAAQTEELETVEEPLKKPSLENIWAESQREAPVIDEDTIKTIERELIQEAEPATTGVVQEIKEPPIEEEFELTAGRKRASLLGARTPGIEEGVFVETKPGESYEAMREEEKREYAPAFASIAKEKFPVISRAAVATKTGLEAIPGGKTILEKASPESEVFEELKKQLPAEAITGTILSSAIQAIAGGGAVASRVKQLSPFLQGVITRAVTAGGLQAARGAEDIARGEKEFKDAFWESVTAAGGGAVSILPELFLPANAIQLLAQPATDLAYDITVAKLRGEELDENWWANEAINFGTSLGFAARDVASGEKFKMTQDEMQKDLPGALRKIAKWSSGRKIESIKEPVEGVPTGEVFERRQFIPEKTPEQAMEEIEARKAITEEEPEIKASDEEIVEYMNRPTLDAIVEKEQKKSTKISLEDIEETIKKTEPSISSEKVKELARKLSIHKVTGLPSEPFVESFNRTPIQEGYSRFWIFGDSDNFKSWNETYSHAHGDVVMRIIMNAINNGVENVRPIIENLGGRIQLGHIGGDELKVGFELPKGQEKLAQEILDKIKEPVRNLKIKLSEDVELPIGLSLGLGESMFKADRALKVAKETKKKNSVIIDEDLPKEYNLKDIIEEDYTQQYIDAGMKMRGDEDAAISKIEKLPSDAERQAGELGRGAEPGIERGEGTEGIREEAKITEEIKEAPPALKETLPKRGSAVQTEQEHTKTKNKSEEIGIDEDIDVDPVSKEKKNILPKIDKVKSALSKITRIFSVERPYKQLNAPETGRAIKLLSSKLVASDERAIKRANEIIKGTESKEELSHIFFQATNRRHINRNVAKNLSQEQKDRIKTKASELNRFMEEEGKQLVDDEALSDIWPNSAIKRNEEKISKLKKQIEAVNSKKWEPRPGIKIGEEKVPIEISNKEKERLRYEYEDELQSQIDNLNKDNKKLKQLKFMHFPARIWLQDKYDNDPEGFRSLLSGDFSGIKGRKTIDPYELVKNNILDFNKVNAAEAVAVYTRYINNQRAQAEIRKLALKEGIAKETDKDIPVEWVYMGDKYPLFKGYKVHPVFAELLDNTFEPVGTRQGIIDRAISSTKMFQFSNPIIMPMYDVFQSVALTQGRALRPKYFKQAIKDVHHKTDSYYEAAENGLYSTPYKNPFGKFKADLDRAMESQGIKDAIKFEAKRLGENPLRIFSDIYSASWNMAWYGDKIIRMATYNSLRNRGYSPKDAAEMAAEAHADYAGVPKRTRKILNRVLFTPTFQISMMKWHANMAASTLKMPIHLINKLRGKEADPKAKKDLIRAASFATAWGILYTKDFSMKKFLGWESEEFCRKYTKDIEYYDEENKKVKKQVVTTFSNPLNVPLKYYYSFVKPKPGMTRSEQIGKYGKYWLTPLLKLADNLIRNEKANGDKIANEWSSPPRQFLDILKFSSSQIFAMYGDLLEEKDETKKEALNSLKKAGSNPFEQMLGLINFFYVREDPDAYIPRRSKRLTTDFFRSLVDKPPTSKDQFKDMYGRLEKQLDELYEKVLDKEAKDIIKQSKEKAKINFDYVNVQISEGEKFTKEEIEKALEKAKNKDKKFVNPKTELRRELRKAIGPKPKVF